MSSATDWSVTSSMRTSATTRPASPPRPVAHRSAVPARAARGADRVPVEVANESEIAVDEAELAGVCRFVLGEMDVNPMAELSVLCVDVEYMSSLHERWMGEKGPTDVLAFPMDELDTARPDDPEPGPALLGDVVLCPAVAVRQARAAGHSMDDELVL